jgi:long-chain acyl-CoA synthetase
MSAASADAPTSAASEAAPEPSARNVPEMLLQRLDDNPEKEAFRFKRGGSWSSLTWGQVGERVRHIAAGLRELGLEPGQRAAILAGTRVDWILADLGILAAGGVTSTIYPASTPAEVAYVVGDSESRIVFAEDDDQVAKLVEVREDLPTVSHVVTIDGSAGHDGWVLTLADLEARGAASEHASDESFRERIASIQPEDLATLIYTSGTTGRPKGVRLSHQTWVYESDGIACLGLLHPEGRPSSPRSRGSSRRSTPRSPPGWPRRAGSSGPCSTGPTGSGWSGPAPSAPGGPWEAGWASA